jgi:hypothetical protein
VHADTYPKPIRLVVPVPPGGTFDIVARLVTQAVAERLNQKIVIENRAADISRSRKGEHGLDMVSSVLELEPKSTLLNSADVATRHRCKDSSRSAVTYSGGTRSPDRTGRPNGPGACG